MNADLARHMVRVAFQTSRDLQDLMGLLREQLTAEEYKSHAIGIAAAIAGIGDALTNKALAAHPELRAEIDEKLAKYGRFV